MKFTIKITGEVTYGVTIDSIMAVLETALPFMADNVDIELEVTDL